jgi:ABC-type glycerol-3-phosphate transport system substrate-binding protein
MPSYSLYCTAVKLEALRLIHGKHLFLIAVLAVASWGLWPTQQPGEIASLRRRTSLNPHAKYVIRMSPAQYMPGTIPQNVGEPLTAFNRVADEFERKFPDTAIEFVEVPSSQREWLVTQLSAEQAPDIFNTNVEDVWQDVQKDWYVPLDQWLEQPNPFVKPGAPGSRQWWDIFKYQSIYRGTRAPNGKMYSIAYDMVETGVFYNKSIFRRLDLHEPLDWSEFLQVQRKLKEAGYVPLMCSGQFLSDWGVDLLFDQLYHGINDLIDLRKETGDRAEYLSNYLDWDEICFLHSKGFFTEGDPRWRDTFRLLKEWRPYLQQSITPGTGVGADFMRDFITQKSAMYWTGSWDVQKLARDPDVSFEWGVFYLPRLTTAQSPYACNCDMCVIGGSAMQYCLSNSAVSDTPRELPMQQRMEKSERLKRCIAFLQFMTIPDNANAVVNEPTMFLPDIVGVAPHRELLPFDEFLKRRYTTTKWCYTFDLRFNDILIRMLTLYLNDGIDEDGFLRWMTQNLDDACDNITRRKNLDFSEFEKVWQQRAGLRRALPGLPPQAR